MSSCPTCQSTDLETDTARGSQVCTKCGMVLEDNIIVSEVQFSETGGGSSGVIGQSVSADGHKPFATMGPSGFHTGYSRDSRMITIDNGRKQIASLAASLSLHSHHIDSAHRYFKLAVEHRFIQGRKTEYVVAACMYIVCRYEKTAHMLLDFADILQVNVFTLGSVYLKLIKKLNVRGMPIIDPSLYILRFANKMDFGDKTHEVSRTALRLVARMKRDWIQVGRRPSGICGAGLLVAARLHGFSRTQRGVVNIVRVCDGTLRKRLIEFEETPSSSLKVKEFMKIDLEGEADPPSFIAGRRKAHKEKLLAANIGTQHDVSERDVEDGDDDIDDDEDEVDLEERETGDGRVAVETVAIGEEADAAMLAAVKEVDPEVLEEASADDSTLPAKRKRGRIDADDGTIPPPPEDPERRKRGIPPPPPEPAYYVPWVEPDDNGALSDLSDTELDEFILKDDEVEAKSKLWHEEHKDYLEKAAQKQKQATDDEKNGIAKPEPKKRKKKMLGNASSAEAAMEQMLARKKTSKKINYQKLFDLGVIKEADIPDEAREKMVADKAKKQTLAL